MREVAQKDKAHLFDGRVWSARYWEHDDPPQDHGKDTTHYQQLSLVKSEEKFCFI